MYIQPRYRGTRIHLEKVGLKKIFSSFVPSKLVEIAIFGPFVRFLPILGPKNVCKSNFRDFPQEIWRELSKSNVFQAMKTNISLGTLGQLSVGNKNWKTVDFNTYFKV